jgi:hypothetical protein
MQGFTRGRRLASFLPAILEPAALMNLPPEFYDELDALQGLWIVILLPVFIAGGALFWWMIV